MAVFVTAHPEDSGNVLFINCDECGLAEPLGLSFEVEDDVLDEAADAWANRHCCGEVYTPGMYMFQEPAVLARFFGLPDEYWR